MMTKAVTATLTLQVTYLLNGESKSLPQKYLDLLVHNATNEGLLTRDSAMEVATFDFRVMDGGEFLYDEEDVEPDQLPEDS